MGGRTLAEFCDALPKAGPLLFQPGTHFSYGVNTDVLGRIVEVVSGMSFGEFLKKEIFDPLGMTDTGFRVPDSEMGRLANNYTPGPFPGPAARNGLPLVDI